MSKKQTQKMDIKTGDISGSGTTNIAGGDINIFQPPPQTAASAFFTIESLDAKQVRKFLNDLEQSS
jgi:hypothetical protein